MNMYEVLKEYKQLLEEGVITQSEFDSKKRELLALPDFDDLKNAEKEQENPITEQRTPDEDSAEKLKLDTELKDGVGADEEKDNSACRVDPKCSSGSANHSINGKVEKRGTKKIIKCFPKVLLYTFVGAGFAILLAFALVSFIESEYAAGVTFAIAAFTFSNLRLLGRKNKAAL